MTLVSLPQDVLREILQSLCLKDIGNLCTVRVLLDIIEDKKIKN